MGSKLHDKEDTDDAAQSADSTSSVQSPPPSRANKNKRVKLVDGGATTTMTTSAGDADEEIAIDDVLCFLERFRVAKGSDFTHTLLGPVRGSYYVPHDDLPTFLDLYSRLLSAGCDKLHVTERHRHISPVCIDVDLRCSDEAGRQKFSSQTEPDGHFYTFPQVVALLKLYAEELFAMLEFPREKVKEKERQKSEIEFYVTEKAAARYDADKAVWKDGFHAMAPFVVTRTAAQHVVRTRLLERADKVFREPIGTLNCIDDILDEAVISKNNWFLYGSRKPSASSSSNETAYELTKIVAISEDGAVTVRDFRSEGDKDAGADEDGVSDIRGRRPTAAELVRTLSLRNKFLETPVLSSQLDEVLQIEDGLDSTRRQGVARLDMRCVIASQPLKGQAAFSVSYADDLDKVKALAEMLSPARSERYIDWIRVGWCLRNIDDSLLETWVAFSRQSEKFAEGVCEDFWARMQRGTLGIGTLHMWAREDNPVKYRELRSTGIYDMVSNCVSGTHHDIAMVVYNMFQHRFVCSSIRNRQWWEFSRHRWRPSDSGYALRRMLSDEVWKEFSNASNALNTRAMNVTNESDQQRQQEMAKKIFDVARRLKNCSFKENIMKECADIFYLANFEERLDSNTNLIGFENGVYDLDADEFREGRPDDFLTFSTGNNYVQYDENSPIADSIQRYLAQVITKHTMREYLLKLLGSFLHGAIREQKFYIWTGSGANSKSMLVDLFEKAFGDYCCKLPVTLLTQKRAASNAATSEVAKAKGKRFACLQEPSEDEKMNIGLMKELSGGDKIMARCIYKEPIEFKPQFKMILLCNHLPDIPSDDDGTWRRIRVVSFTSKFVNVPNPDSAETEFLIDMSLPVKMEAWKEMFMALIIRYYRRYSDEGNPEPDEVLECTNDYKNQNDHLAEFLQTRVEKDDTAFLGLTEAFNEARAFLREANIVRFMHRNAFEKYLCKKLGKLTVFNSVKGYRGFRMTQPVEPDVVV